MVILLIQSISFAVSRASGSRRPLLLGRRLALICGAALVLGAPANLVFTAATRGASGRDDRMKVVALILAAVAWLATVAVVATHYLTGAGFHYTNAPHRTKAVEPGRP